MLLELLSPINSALVQDFNPVCTQAYTVVKPFLKADLALLSNDLAVANNNNINITIFLYKYLY